MRTPIAVSVSPGLTVTSGGDSVRNTQIGMASTGIVTALDGVVSGSTGRAVAGGAERRAPVRVPVRMEAKSCRFMELLRSCSRVRARRFVLVALRGGDVTYDATNPEICGEGRSSSSGVKMARLGEGVTVQQE